MSNRALGVWALLTFPTESAEPEEELESFFIDDDIEFLSPKDEEGNLAHFIDSVIENL